MTESDAHSALCKPTQRRPPIKDLSQSDFVSSFWDRWINWISIFSVQPRQKGQWIRNGSKFVACLDQIQPCSGFLLIILLCSVALVRGFERKETIQGTCKFAFIVFIFVFPGDCDHRTIPKRWDSDSNQVEKNVRCDGKVIFKERFTKRYRTWCFWIFIVWFPGRTWQPISQFGDNWLK